MDTAKRDYLCEYSNTIKNLRKECLDAGMNEEEFKEVYSETLKSVEEKQNPAKCYLKSGLKRFILVLAGTFILFLIGYNHQAIYSCIVCNLQEYIYPVLRLLRRMFIPIISLFPSLTEYYQEPCLVQNPFFTVVDMDCWPCSTVYAVKEIYNHKPIMQHQNAPFFYESDQSPINMEMLEDLYLRYKEVLESDVPKILTNNKYHLYPKDLFEMLKNDEKSLNIWKFNTMNEAKVLRQIIPRPKIVPKFGQSTERFVIIDSSHETFKIPDTECSFSFLLSLNGSRTIDLIPATECKHQCKSLQVELKETYLLWYNWWYWRPRIQSTTRNGTFIAHVGSYC